MQPSSFFPLALLLAACGNTFDSVGYDDPRDAAPDAARTLRPLIGPASYPNAFGTVLGKTDAEITAKISNAFDLLFHGDLTTQAIFYPAPPDRAFIRDTLHDDVRTEGIGWGMIVAVELNKQVEFDQLWRYAKFVTQYASGSNAGYFLSSCDTPSGAVPCVDPFGLQQFVMALLFAHGRWRSAGAIDYATEALSLFDVMRNKEAQNGGIVDGVTNSFDASTKLVFDVPNTVASTYSRPSIEMPGYYELWAQATGDSFWTDAASAARDYWQRSAHAGTGLMPTRASFDGTPVAGSDTFEPEGYRTQINMVIDRIFFGKSQWEVDESNRLLDFFFQRGIDQYGREYGLDGTLVDGLHDPSLVAVNGTSALIATSDQRTAFLDAAWNLPVPTGVSRYYSGILDLLMLLILSGQYRVY
jgi:oligosaccharide reducing-end xylanase